MEAISSATQAAGAGRARRGRRWLLGLLLAVALLVWLLCFLLEPEPKTVLAPFLGPWAGHVHGHESCTMANAMPRLTWLAVGLGAVALAAALLPRRRWSRLLALVSGSLWAVLWLGLALLSLVNMQS